MLDELDGYAQDYIVICLIGGIGSLVGAFILCAIMASLIPLVFLIPFSLVYLLLAIGRYEWEKMEIARHYFPEG